MVHNNKVLTVSYGTFSCTLEGFEDSFGTMKAIAEYFRDLASDDRYFGAEPPQPDAEMLARIAQREVARQVEARTSSDGIHLRTAAPEETISTPVTSQPAVAPVAAPQQVDAATAEESQPAETPSHDESSVDLSSVELFDAPTEAPSEVETLDQLVETPASTPAMVATSGPVEDHTAAPQVDMATIAAISAATSETSQQEPDETPVSEVELFIEEAPSTSAPAPTPPSATVVPAADSIAAKLQRIRAVVSQTPEDDFSEDEHAEVFVETARAEMVQDEEEDSSSLDTDAEMDEISRVLDRLDLSGEAKAEAAEQQPSEETVSSHSSETLIAATLAETTPQQEAQTADASEAETDVTEPARTRPKRSIRLSRRAVPESAVLNQADGVKEDNPENRAEGTVDANDAPPSVGATAPEQEITPTQEEASIAQDDSPAENTAAEEQPLRARIVKVKRKDLEQAMISGNLEEIAEDEEPAAQATHHVESTLDADEEAELLRELAEVEAELLASNQDEPELQASADASVPAEQTDNAELRASATVQPAASPDSDVSRLMAAAESKLGDPDNTTSRETYSHLRAAVAAAEADRSAGKNNVEADDAEAYREDLANVVRPRRPGADGTAKSQRPRNNSGRPAPLKLVAEQRIDPEPQAPAAPVRPRRISTPVEETAPAKSEGIGSFSDYVQDRGAAELHELLEAAASYLSFVEGRDHFSRPQLMNKVRSIGHADFNRENGLRSIGLLLREGKIERSDNGNFSATDDIGFRPPKRAAG